jgi:hypothetical protein
MTNPEPPGEYSAGAGVCREGPTASRSAAQSFDGKVPVFCNTGKEREETTALRHECGSRWGAHVVWLERPPGGGFQRVGYNSADRNGEAFAARIAERQMPPNWKMRFCTADLKVRPKVAFAEVAGLDGLGQCCGPAGR